MGVPTSYVGTDGTTHDLADDIGQATFANAPLQSAGNHAYYAVPLGQDASSSMWHSATTIATTTTQGFRDNYKKQPGTQTVYNKTLEGSKDGGSSTWIVSLNVTWSSQTYAQQIYPTFSTIWQKTNGNTIIYNNPIGTTWQLKIRAAVGASPAQVRAAVEDIAQQSIKQGPSGAKITIQQDVETLPPPAVEVTNSALTFV
ncbi:hypothetical protein BU23DRAFT_574945 [Bimuria novae-zelandiae CBS 107.79]|uniref:Uncharacterized protein n=1 Tax=Bimuria novae-zelandiae CBS 107.79 TaxID=1447943 RepID=A0A6A5UQX6_9PLEO|nr:hypothetical protein BU23DRAFT_574945 [Bimuria novae-zelandiae CBS 107.79]